MKIRAKEEQAFNTLDNLVQSRKNKKGSGKDFLKVAQTVKVFNQKIITDKLKAMLLLIEK
jgi:hypothetical protein